MAQPNPPTKTEQLANTGKKAAEKMGEMASNAGSKIKDLFSRNNDIVDPGKLSLNQIKNKKMETQIIFFIFFFIGILVFVALVFVSKTFRVYTSLSKMAIYKSNEINQKSIFDIYKGDGLKEHKIRDFYIASAYRPYVCYYHKYDYCSLEVFREVLMAGPRFIELEIFNDSFSVDVEPVVSIGTEEGDWKFSLNTLKLTDVLKVIAETVFNVKYMKELFKDPFILYYNLKVNRNVIALDKIHKYTYNILGQFLLDIRYSFNSSREKANFNSLTLDDVKGGKIILLANSGFEGSPLEEIINYSTVSNYTLENFPEQYRMMYLKHGDVVEKEEDIEEYANTTYFKVTADNLKNYNKCSFSILSPEGQNSDSFFDGITPYNPEPSKGLETGCQFIMMNYQKIDTNMSNYTYIFKDSSFVLKSDNLTDNNNNCVRNFTSIKTQKLEHTNSEVVYTYVTPKDQIPENP